MTSSECQTMDIYSIYMPESGANNKEKQTSGLDIEGTKEEKEMKCQTHFTNDAVTFCKDCHAPMCAKCNSALGAYCTECATRISENGRLDIIKTFALSVVSFIAGIIWMGSIGNFQTEPLSAIVTCLMMLFLPFGWKGISFISDLLLPIASLLGWIGLLLFFCFKFAIAVMIGWIFGIPKLLEAIRLWKSYQRTEEVVKNIKMAPAGRGMKEV